ncbi:BLUF domain-containing protein [Siccirubricoccus phaeus]|uniref:BLUF domain-containing protein n=1 Tax=Siccirubricoccus phaeus TaxID=2595053 RepID=UPI00165B0826|nr:BLUF domain-containing protein [Siccirubricoccus phaeus]
MAEPLYRLLYRSKVAILGTTEEVRAEVAAILAGARRHNAAAGLTGALLHEGATFTQVLEGELPALEEAYDRISADLRHTEFELMQFALVPERGFGGEALAFLAPAELDAAGLAAPGDAADAANGVLRRMAAILGRQQAAPG